MRCLDVVAEMMGFQLDALKSANDVLEMTVLGEMVSIRTATREITIRVAKDQKSGQAHLTKCWNKVNVKITKRHMLQAVSHTQWDRPQAGLDKFSSDIGMHKRQHRW